MCHALAALHEWHGHSQRRRFLAAAVNQLRGMLAGLTNLIDTNAPTVSGERLRDTGCAAVQLAVWHWQATASLLCSRSESVLNIRQQGLAKILARILASLSVTNRDSIDIDTELARLRQVCVLMDLIRGSPKLSQSVFGDALMRRTYIVLWVRGLIISIQYRAYNAVEMCIMTLRWALIDQFPDLDFLATKEDAQAVASELLGCLGSHLCGLEYSISDNDDTSMARFQVEWILADLLILRGLSIELVLESTSSFPKTQVRRQLSTYIMSSRVV